MSRQSRAALVAAMSIIILIMGCSSGSDSGTGEVSSALDGVWRSNCVFDPDENEYEIYQFEPAKGTFLVLIESYSDSACTVQLFDYSVQGTYTEPGTSTLSTGETATLLDSRLQNSTLTPTNVASVDSQNQEQVCGIGTWALNVSIDVSSCQGFPSFTYDIYTIENSTLLLGDSSGDQNGDTPALRPTTLDRLRPYTRVSN